MPPPAATDDPALEKAWAALVARAAARMRAERVRAGLFHGALASVPVFAAAAGCSLAAQPGLARAALAIAFALPLVGALAGRLRPLSETRLHARIDRQFGLADEALAARELSGRASPAWRSAVLRQALAHAGSADWKLAWPLRWPRRSGLAASAALLAALLALVQLPRLAPVSSDPAAARRAEQQAALSELAKDWEKTADQLQGEEWDAFRDTLAELQKQLAAPELGERELLVALARVESRLAEAKSALADSALATQSEELAEALAGLENLDEATRALRERDFAQAAKNFDNASARLAADAAKLEFRDATGAETARRLEKLAEKAAKTRDPKFAETAKKMREAVEKRDAKSLGQCSASLAAQSREAAARESAASALSSVARSLSDARLALAEGRKPGESESPASFAGQGQAPGAAGRGPSGDGPPADGIGSGAGDHSLGPENELAAAARQENLSGVANAEGESTKRTVRASQGAPTLAGAATEAELAESMRLSREAVLDESIPLEHRRAIHRYFQLIRPTSETADSAVSTSP